MRNNKKGLSTIVVTLILIVLSLVAVGAVWLVVSPLIKSGSQGADVSVKCLNTNIEATKVACTAGSCAVTLTRTGTNTDAIGGVKLVFKDATGASSAVLDSAGNIKALAGKVTNSLATTLATPNKVEITPYFKDAGGNEQLCTQTTSFSFVA
ncbi:Uncharacterised protein [uncultured archaeon]|nr:Uncharacterised protein [uncultured archaeon]